MSFILDALKKMEKKRQHSPVPNILTVHELPLKETKKRLLWPYLILSALLLINAVILSVWLRPWETGKTEIVAQTLPVKIHESVKTEVMEKDIVNKGRTSKEALSPESDAPAINPVNVMPQSQPVQTETDEQEEPEVETTASLEISPAIQETQEVISYTPDNTAPVSDNETVSGQRVPDVSELPQSVLQNLPEIVIYGHIYSDNPASRLVNINRNIIREGGTVTSGLKVEEIIRSGVIFSFQDFLFQIRTF